MVSEMKFYFYFFFEYALIYFHLTWIDALNII